uniref:YdcF family protein n=1 Tax=Candidatus Pelagibacter sp. TaxID=2024849 RepID=UPI0040494DF9
MIYLHKILPLIFSPLILVIGLIILGIIFNLRKFSLIGIIILILSSLPIISNKFIAYLEKDYQPIEIADVENVDAIVVLSGMIRVIGDEENLKYEFTDSVDRFFAGLDLFNNNKSPILILTRGKMPWSIGIAEGEYLKELAIKYGVSEENIILTDEVQNTDQEAKAIKEILTEDAKIILVTSAFHMPRAEKVFKAANINLIPYPVDFQNSKSKTTMMDFIPSAGSLFDTSHFVREMIGRLYYNLKY